MGFTNGGQLYDLFLCCGLGFLLGAYYDVFRVCRLVMRSGARTIFAQDVVYFSTSAVTTFLFALVVTNGELRFYLFFGSLVGFAAYYFTIGRVVIRCAGTVCAAVLWLWKQLWRIIFFPFRALWHLLKRPLGALGGGIEKISKKGAGILKKGLKEARSLVYNRKRKKAPPSETEK